MSDTNTKKLGTEEVVKIKKGSEDLSGNIVKLVLARYNEFVIYEIEDDDINNRLKILIDGYTDESENILIQKFNLVKQNYIKAKGLLYRSSNFGMMKNRIAHLLSSVLLNSKSVGEISRDEVNKEFEDLISEIEEEYSKSITHRLLYLVPSFTVIILIIISYFCNSYFKEYLELWSVIFGASIGGTMSIILRVNKNNFEEHLKGQYYLFIGLERIILALLAGIIAYIGIKSGILFANLQEEENWTIMAISVLSGFSEALIPSLLKKISNEKFL